MRSKFTLVLLFLNVALFFFIFGFEREWRIREEAQQARRRVLGPEAANIEVITINAPGAEAIRLRRTPETWMLTEPIEWPANPHAVSRIVNELQFLEHETSFTVEDLSAAGQTLADYGLETPALVVGFSAAPAAGGEGEEEPATISLAIGAETSVGNRLYILSPDGERVHVVNRSLADSLRVTLEQLRSDTCFTIPIFEVRSLNLQTAGPANVRVRLRREGNRWSFEAPVVARASKTATELTINGLNALHTRDFLGSARARPELAARAGTGSPTLRVTLEGNNRRETLLLGQAVPAPPVAPPPAAEPASGDASPDVLYYAQMEDRDAIFTVPLPTDLLDTLRNAQEELRDPRVLPLEGREVSAITIAAPNAPNTEPLTLQRLEPPASAPTDPAPWQIVRTGGAGPQTRPADRQTVERLLQHLVLLSAEEFLRDVPSDAELENWGLTQPERRITLTLAPDPANPTAPTSLTLLLGVATERGGRVYAKLANQTFVYLVSTEILRVTPVVPRIYRDRLLYDLPTGARITGLTLTELSTDAQLYRHALSGGETWADVFARESPERAAALTTLRNQLRTLRAQRFVRDGFTPTIPVQGEERPWAYRLDVTLSLTGGATNQEEVRQLFFAPRTGGATQWVGLPEPQFDVIFEAEQPLLDALWVLTYRARDPAAPAPASSAVAPATAEPDVEPEGEIGDAPAPTPPLR